MPTLSLQIGADEKPQVKSTHELQQQEIQQKMKSADMKGTQ